MYYNSELSIGFVVEEGLSKAQRKEDKDNITKNTFYEHLDRSYESTPGCSKKVSLTNSSETPIPRLLRCQPG